MVTIKGPRNTLFLLVPRIQPQIEYRKSGFSRSVRSYRVQRHELHFTHIKSLRIGVDDDSIGISLCSVL